MADDWSVIRALTRETPVERHSQRCPCYETRAGIERCSCWVLSEARRTSKRVGAVYAKRRPS